MWMEIEKQRRNQKTLDYEIETLSSQYYLPNQYHQ